MKNFFALAVVACLAGSAGAQRQQANDTERVVSTAEAFLATLTPDQLRQVVYAFDDQTQRARWSNFPTGVVPRGGISLKQMNPAQREAAMQSLAVVLSPMGLQKVNEIRQADDDFKANGSKRGPLGNGGPPPRGSGTAGEARGKPFFSSDDLFGSGLYYLSILGKPSATQPWMLQFGGHHLALNITVAGERGVLTPSLTGAQPAVFTLNGKTVRPLGRESDKAVALLQSLNETRRRRAVLGYAVADLVLGPGQDGKTIVPDGLKASEMDSSQQALLLDLIAEWAGIINTRSAAMRMDQVKTELRDTWFAWSGPVTGKAGENITAYYRIQGPHLVIEYAPQSDEPGNHVHTIYRDPTNDYGRGLVKP